MKKTVILLLFIILSCKCTIAQKSIQPLKVGDKLPNYELKNLFNYPSRTARFSDFNGKFIMLEFWNTTCEACIAGFPKVEALQKEFQEKLQIILLNPWQRESLVKAFLDRRKQLANLSLSIPVGARDSVLLSLFSIHSVPHVVWIDNAGLIRSITAVDAVNSKNIKLFLSGHVPDMYQKNDEYSALDFKKPLFINGNGGNGNKLMWQSVLSGYTDKLRHSWYLLNEEDNGIYKIGATNSCIRDLYRFAYSNYYYLSNNGAFLERLPLNRIQLEVEKESKYTAETDNELLREFLYTYQLTAPRASQQELQKMMREDLRRYFNLNVQWKKVAKKCLVLTVADTALIKYNEGGTNFVFNGVSVKLNNITISKILNWMELATDYYHSPYPLIDESGFKGKVGKIEFETDVYDFKKLADALKKYKMDLVLEDREVDVLFISEMADL